MGCLVAIETDPKCCKEIEESWKDISKEHGHTVHIFKSLSDFSTEFLKPEFSAKNVLVLMVSQEKLGPEPEKQLAELKTKYKCEVLLSLFDDPLKPIKNLENYPVHNIIYKPFDLTIFKEHTRFSIFPNQNIKTQFVHTTISKNKFELLKKFKIVQLSEISFKIEKNFPLEMGKHYKFYHPLFLNKKQQSAWGQVVGEDATHYELIFTQLGNTPLSQIRKKVAGSAHKVKSPNWRWCEANKKFAIKIYLQLDDEATVKSFQELIERNFKDVQVVHKKQFKPNEKVQCDIVITEANHEKNSIKNDFTGDIPKIIRIYSDANATKREVIESRFEYETYRIEKPADKSFLVKAIRTLFPSVKENEPFQLVTVHMEEYFTLSEEISVVEFSEAGITFHYPKMISPDEVLKIALPQEDETQIKEMKTKIHYVNQNINEEKMYLHQTILFGMKDELLKLMRLWTLQIHIKKNKQD